MIVKRKKVKNVKLKFIKMNNKYANEVLNWHYNGKYSFYDIEFDKEDLEEFFKKIKNNNWGNKYIALDEDEKLVGIFNYGFGDNVMEIGLGLRPDLTGKGIGESYIKAGIEFGKNKFKYIGKTVKLAVVAFNIRAIKVYERIGFKEVNRYMQKINDKEYEFINMIKNI